MFAETRSQGPWLRIYYVLVGLIVLALGWLAVCPSILALNQSKQMVAWLQNQPAQQIVRAVDIEHQLPAEARYLFEFYSVESVAVSKSNDWNTRLDFLLQDGREIGVIVPTDLHKYLYKIDLIASKGALANILPQRAEIYAYRSVNDPSIKVILNEYQQSFLLAAQGLEQFNHMILVDNSFDFFHGVSVAVKSLWNDVVGVFSVRL